MNVRRKFNKLRDITKLFVFGLPKFAVGSIDVTNRCNLRCEHCYFFAEDHNNEKELSIEKWLEKLEAMKAAGHPMMLCTWVGGRSSRTCTRRPTSLNGMKSMAAIKSMQQVSRFR